MTADPALAPLGIRVVVGEASMAAAVTTVRDDMINAHDVYHGGFLFLLADTALAYPGAIDEGRA